MCNDRPDASECILSGKLSFDEVFVYARWIARDPSNKLLRTFFAACFDVCCVLPLLDLPIYYLLAEFAEEPDGFFRRAICQYRECVAEDTLAAAAIWLPVNCFNFFLIPPQYRGLVFAAGG